MEEIGKTESPLRGKGPLYSTIRRLCCPIPPLGEEDIRSIHLNREAIDRRVGACQLHALFVAILVGVFLHQLLGLLHAMRRLRDLVEGALRE